MKVLPIAFDSFGVRSMATLVILKHMKIFIDPGVALGPVRYGLRPSKEEFKALEICRKNIMKFCKKCDIIIVTHYHYDHHPFPDDKEMYKCFYNKKLLIKDVFHDINLSGKKRGRIFLEHLEKHSEIIPADNNKFKLSNANIEFSPAVWHGEVGSRVGRVIMAYIKERRTSLLFGSDAQGLADKEALKFAIQKNPLLAIIDGYPTLFIGWRMSKKSFENSKQHVKMFLEKTSVQNIIIDHHILRDINYKEKMKDVFEVSKTLNKNMMTAAEFYKLKNLFLEAWRKDIHNKIKKVNVSSYYAMLRKKIKMKTGI